MANIIRTIPEPNKSIDVVRECDVVVVGGGPGGIGAAVSVNHGVSVRNVDYSSLRKQLIAQNAPLPGSYPDKFKRAAKGPAAIYENPIFRERNLKE